MSTTELLAYFFQTCRQRFAFLSDQHGFSSLAGLTSYDRGRHIITPYDQRQLASYPFDATTRYEKDDTFIELSYGDYNFTLECYVTYERRYRFLLTDLMPLLPKTKKAPIQLRQDPESRRAPQAHHIASLLQTYKDILSSYSTVLFAPPRDFITLALDQQAVQQAKAIAQQYRQNKQRACEKAAQAFTDQDYRTAIMLYRPYKDDLEPHDHRIFSLAIMQLDQ